MKTQNDELLKRLEKLAYKKSHPFCYSCYRRVEGTHCKFCGSDDNMRELAGEGVEYGVDWIIKFLIRENLTLVDTEEAFEESVRQCYPETTQIGWMSYDTASAMKELDPVSWRIAESEWIDNEVEDDQLRTFDNGSTYYSVSDLEDYLDQEESDDEDAA